MSEYADAGAAADPSGQPGGMADGGPGPGAAGGGPGSGAAGGGPGGAGQPSEEELRAAYEAELSRITAVDMMAQTAVSLLNIGARRLDMAGEGADAAGGSGAGGLQQDMEQARDAIDGARALLEILERRIPRELGPLRDALSRLQMAYAREAQSAGGAAGAGATSAGGAAAGPAGASQPQSPPAPPSDGGQAPASGEQPAERGPGPAESSGRLWVPGR